MYSIGVVSAVDVPTCRARVKFPAKGDVESYWLEVLQSNTFISHDYGLPDVGETVAVMLDEGGESGCILGAIYTGANKPPHPGADVRRVDFGDGTAVAYDRAAHKLTIEMTGNVKVQATNVDITAAVKVTGNIDANGDLDLSGKADIGGAANITGATKIGSGSEPAAKATSVTTVLNALKAAIAGAAVTPLDGGATLKANIVAALAAWPTPIASSKLTID
jgi:phage baseplate assembly protein V